MRFSTASVLAFATTALCVVYDPTPGYNVITKPTEGEQVQAGSTYEIVWQPDATNPGPATIGLLGGPKSNDLTVVATIKAGIDPSTGSFDWEVPSTLGDLAIYGIKITLDSNTDIFQYGFPFQIVGGESGSSTSASATASETETEGSASATKTASGTAKSTTKSASTTASIPSSTIVTSTTQGNMSTTASRQTTITSLVTQDPPTSTGSSTSSIVTNGVASLAAGSFAMLGGVAMAVLAL
ncbi:Ser-Thr-rich glycosyl-phosphatidyl-inositol-anchored membrane family-domain-containing protein [Chaetomidium leptoderma]|uniref:Ser-Thr-rich glycosyl-phosphatidyl-inositol-anchored membrane family-domain-containing protein n=1 Tax=Chaetomidium leptoderma TaxID=669021 RepID=A0AAN6VKN6_9PEZI|nr:Ser-Thr-rich glycosyl-phosphatidyl-inositol-anchored membrane family-domain-containing protein [Chaetomidium leptoderma]